MPLASLTVAHEAASALSEFADIIKDEVNVKDLVLNDDPATLGEFQLTVNPRALGPRLGKQVQEVIRAVKADPQLRSIPFVFLTATMCNAQDRARGLALGAARFLFRPIEPQVLLAEVAACLRDGLHGR